jgi:hypothetical protein
MLAYNSTTNAIDDIKALVQPDAGYSGLLVTAYQSFTDNSDLQLWFRLPYYVR